MSQRVSRRTLVALAGGAALSAATLRHAAAAQASSPFTFPGGSELSWVAPWEMYSDNYAATVLANSASLQSGNGGEFLVGYYDAPTTINASAESFLTFLGQEPSPAMNISGGSGPVASPDGTESFSFHSVYAITLNDEAWGIHFELVDDLALTVFVAPVAIFAEELASAQSSVMLDGIGVLGRVNGAAIQQQLEEYAGGSAGSDSAEVGEYTDSSGFLHVTWTNGWTVKSQNETGIQLTNPAQSIVLYTEIYPMEGKSWQEMADEDVAFLYDDQGSSATLSGPEVTDSGHAFATNGQYGLRLVQGVGSDNPDLYVLVFAANMTVSGADALPLLQEAQAAVLINGTPPLVGLENFL